MATFESIHLHTQVRPHSHSDVGLFNSLFTCRFVRVIYLRRGILSFVERCCARGRKARPTQSSSFASRYCQRLVLLREDKQTMFPLISCGPKPCPKPCPSTPCPEPHRTCVFRISGRSWRPHAEEGLTAVATNLVLIATMRYQTAQRANQEQTHWT